MMMQYRKKRPVYLLPLVVFVLVSAFSAALPRPVDAADAGVGRRTGGIVEIDLVSAVKDSTVVRSLPTQEGAPQGFGALSDVIRIIDLATGAVLSKNGSTTSADGQYNAELFKPLVTDQRIQAFNVTRGFYSSGVTVKEAQPPAIDEPVLQGAVLIKGRGTPGHSVQIRNVVTGVVLGTGTVVSTPGLANGTFSIKLIRSLPLFFTIQPIDTTAELIGKKVTVLNLLTDHSALKSSCGIGQVVIRGFIRRWFACGLPRPRGVTLDDMGNPLIVAGTAPLDPGSALLPAGIFRLAPATGALSLFAPVNGVGLKRSLGGAFGEKIFVARPRFFNVRKAVQVYPGDGEIFLVDPASSQIQVLTRFLDFAPTGIAFGEQGTPFPHELLASNLFSTGLRRIRANGAAFAFTKLPHIQGLAFGAGGKFGSELYAAQPSSGRILRISAGGAITSFVKGLISPVDVAFGPGGAFGADLYVADAGARQIVRIDDTGARTLFAAGFGAPFGLVFSTSPPALYVTDYLTGNVVQFTPAS